MKLIFPAIIANLIISVVSYKIPDAIAQHIKPKGFRLSIPHEEGITEVSFNIRINRSITLYQPGDFASIITEPIDNIWAFENINTILEVGSRINYWIHVQFGSAGTRFRDVGTVIISASTEAVVLTDFCPKAGDSVKQQCPPSGKSDCEPSVTKVGGKSMCKGQLIFEDTFDTLDWKKWNREVRIPLTADDGQFVSFQSRPENCYVNNGVLHIVPSFLSTETNVVRSGTLNLETECTGILDRSLECKKKAKFFQILPPIVSARIRTKNSFSFRFGKIEIRAKLPKGDWLFPLVLLEPLENYYGMTDYASGQIRIAFNRGNEILIDESAKDISNKWLSGGAVMTNSEKLRGTYLRGKDTQLDLSSNFHNYTLRWTEDQLLFGIDDNEYAVIKENFLQIQKRYHGATNSDHKMTPFDREFFLTLGVSAGGHADFPDNCRNGLARTPKPWLNGDPKAELYFWKDRNNWYSTWKGDNRGLHVDYIRVYAL